MGASPKFILQACFRVLIIVMSISSLLSTDSPLYTDLFIHCFHSSIRRDCIKLTTSASADVSSKGSRIV